MNPIERAGKMSFQARALLLGARLDLRSLGTADRLAADPIVVAAGNCGVAVLFRYGAVVLFDVSPLEEGELIRQLQPLIQEPFPSPETESIELRIDPAAREGLEGNVLSLADFAVERLQLVADVLSKSIVLAMYEARIRRSFDIIEPFAADLERDSRSRRTKLLLQHIGSALLSEHNLVGRVEVVDKPDLLWEQPGLERFYLRLEDDFEIAERHRVIERKLDLISRTAETVHQVLQARSSLRTEWYIVVLILVEIGLTLYQMFVGQPH